MQRIIMFQIIAINNAESDFSKNSSNRGDTSQNVSPCMHVCAFAMLDDAHNVPLCLIGELVQLSQRQVHHTQGDEGGGDRQRLREEHPYRWLDRI